MGDFKFYICYKNKEDFKKFPSLMLYIHPPNLPNWQVLIFLPLLIRLYFHEFCTTNIIQYAFFPLVFSVSIIILRLILAVMCLNISLLFIDEQHSII